MERIGVQTVSVTQECVQTPDGNAVFVYGLHTVWTNGESDCVPDLGTDLASVTNLAEQLKHSDLERIHFADVLEDFLT